MMTLTDSAKELNKFFNKFCPAYLQDNVPSGTSFPYLTYSLEIPTFYNEGNTIVKVYTKGSSLIKLFEIADLINAEIGEDGVTIGNTEGMIYFTKGNPFAQFISDEDEIKTLYINLTTQVG